MNRGIVSLLIGQKHLCMAAVSVMTLRRWYDGPLTLFVDETAQPYAERIADAAPPTAVSRFDVRVQKRHTGYANKPRLPSLSPYDLTLQLDLDTLIVGELEGEIWPRDNRELVVTPFADWVTTGGVVSSRIRKWADVAPEQTAKMTARSYPAMNTGVISYGRESEIARRHWLEMTLRKPTAFIADETAMDLIWTEYPNVRCIEHDRWNWSAPFGVATDDIRIVHGHGAKFFKRKKHKRGSPGCIQVWWPWFKLAVDSNFADIADWWREDNNRHLRHFIKQNPTAFDEGFRIADAVIVQE